MRNISPETNRKAIYRGLENEVYSPGVVVEIVTDDSWLDDIIATITAAHDEGLIGGRGIQVLPVEEGYRVRDGFMDMP
jgi:nitrogen regulatory protein PII